jgi:hypothetical protein
MELQKSPHFLHLRIDASIWKPNLIEQWMLLDILQESPNALLANGAETVATIYIQQFQCRVRL